MHLVRWQYSCLGVYNVCVCVQRKLRLPGWFMWADFSILWSLHLFLLDHIGEFLMKTVLEVYFVSIYAKLTSTMIIYVIVIKGNDLLQWCKMGWREPNHWNACLTLSFLSFRPRGGSSSQALLTWRTAKTPFDSKTLPVTLIQKIYKTTVNQTSRMEPLANPRHHRQPTFNR